MFFHYQPLGKLGPCRNITGKKLLKTSSPKERKMKINLRNLDVICSIALNLGKKLQNTKFPNLNKAMDIANNIYIYYLLYIYIYIYYILFNPVSHLDDPDVDIVYYVSENRGAWGFQNKQTNKQTNYNTSIGGAFGIQPNVCGRAFFENIVNLLRLLTIFVEKLHRGCLTRL